jgi:hypothetical protein
LEVGGKRFVKLRNPWGKTEWSGRWSDGSKEWTSEWLLRLPELGHSFGNDGEFVMECERLLGDRELDADHDSRQGLSEDVDRHWEDTTVRLKLGAFQSMAQRSVSAIPVSLELW